MTVDFMQDININKIISFLTIKLENFLFLSLSKTFYSKNLFKFHPKSFLKALVYFSCSKALLYLLF